MKTLWKTVLIIITLLGMCCLTLPLSAVAATSWVQSTECPEYEYQIQDDGTIRLSGTNMFSKRNNRFIKDGVYRVPSQVDGYTVTSIAGYQGHDLLKTIIVPDTVKTLEQYAFYDFEYLETLILPEGLEVVGHHVTRSNHFKEVVVPSTVTKIDYTSFGMVLNDPTMPGSSKRLEGFTVYSHNNPAVIAAIQEPWLTEAQMWTHIDLDSLPKGDFNRDDMVDMKDAMLLYSKAAGKMIGDAVQQYTGDITGDATINMIDVARLYQRVSGK